MNQLANDLKIVLASSFSLFLKTAFCHWNVEGPYFSQLHQLFGDQYAEIYDSIDLTAEKIRTIGSYSPGSLARFQQLSIITDEIKIPSYKNMITNLIQDHIKMIDLLNSCFKTAEAAGDQAIMNYIAERLDAHKKHHWMLTATSKL